MAKITLLALLFICLDFFSFSHAKETEILVEDYNLIINKCETYPYFNARVDQKDGNRFLKRDFFQVIQTAQSCVEKHHFSSYVVNKFQMLFRILESQKVKTLTCNYGVTNGYYAVASSQRDEDEQGHQDPGLPPHPSALFDTNRMAGNFPVSMTLEEKEKFVAFYGGDLSLEEIIPGTRNPKLSYIQDPASLVFHEMFHWTESFHFPKEYPDIVYLTQFCCFPQDKHSSQEVAWACELLEKRDAWQKDKEKRLEFLSKENIQEKVKKLISKYH